jgi:hypothetical protein
MSKGPPSELVNFDISKQSFGSFEIQFIDILISKNEQNRNSSFYQVTWELLGKHILTSLSFQSGDIKLYVISETYG